ncbi:diguanylate cyclase domain-containing protein [Deinococcus detaillensis]|uniref:diguanylate cyclase domain-containing protein n=1 Tax=Deinococcus detaillensis TaxID=2592048 RepID=UPI001CDC8E96|nr:diguanylate cyclase [Deinococcus detaillensis]
MVSAQGQSEKGLRPAIRDDLTLLPLRAALTFDFLQLGGKRPASLLMCDLDHLKLINDTLGHAAGDQALRTLSAALGSHQRPDWQAYRLGGDEFALLASVPAAELHLWAQHLLSSVQRASLPISVSVGIAEVAQSADLGQVLAQADQRLYAAKRRGKAQIISQDVESPFETPTPRLLERGPSLDQGTQFLRAAFQGQAAELLVHAPPGGGLSAFLQHLEVVARTLGYQTLHLSGSAARECQHYGVWDQATLNGQRLSGQHLTPAAQPLAILLDRPECFDAATLVALQPLLRTAQVVLRGQAGKPASAALTGLSSSQITLEPLSENALGELLGRERLEPQTRRWLYQRAGGLPAPTLRWLAALRLEASLRRETLTHLLSSLTSDWETAVAYQLTQPLLWPRPLLYGRRTELQEAVKRLSLGSLLTITGPAGRGKTRLAEQILGELGSHFARVQSVSLSGTLGPEMTLSRLAEALLGRPSERVDLASLGRLLARQPTLLLLDEPAEQQLSAQMLETLLSSAPLSRIIVTARAPLGAQHESVLALEPLSEQSVTAALQEKSRSRLSAAQLRQMADWISGEPLRLSAAAALLNADPASAAQRLGSGEPYPAWLLLGGYERRVLAAMSSVSGPFELSWAEALSGASPFLLGALRDQQYLQAVGGGLYRLAGALGAGAQTVWHTSPDLRRQVGQRALRQLQRLLGAQPEGSAAWYMQLDQHYPTVRAVVAGLLLRPAPLSRELAEVLLGLLPYRLSRGYLPEARAELELALQRGTALDVGWRQRLGLALASVAQQCGDHAAAQTYLSGLEHLSVPLLWKSTPPIPLPSALAHSSLAPLGHKSLATFTTNSLAQPNSLAEASLIEARLLHRRSLYIQSHALYRAIGAQPDLPLRLKVKAMEGQARAAVYLGQLNEAQHQIGTVVNHVERHLEEWGELLLSDVLNTAALVATEQRRLSDAKALFERTLEIHRRYGHRAGLTLNLTGLAWVLLLSGDFQRSAELTRQVLRQAQDAGRLWEEANALINLGHALTRSGELTQARQTYRQGGTLALQHDAPSLVAEALGGLAEVLSGEGQQGLARSVLSAALAHSGANAEVRQYFSALIAKLGPLPAFAESGESADWKQWLQS